ncbi:hypothetical protein BDV37DRAFT_277874 [Aspergillus pseudonomiae]|uniref:Zn(2)-C6 fungal-type domain-containing protein n=1 Tax=Aspergillus pseudonomiae TaxID=1506151 RepID=A0A5N7DSU8_9EURO|nr:uncharacterized protein BDV37DRAFT_277874 [Aspergillus pseudonomiae]KAE8409531.1 hypothetical protein BDV37DRAFT_277874 [Aspergillus pseudonomiae]
MYEPPSRQACDRCHDLKLRCHRNDAGKCSRCQRAGASCVFSPSNRGRRPNHQLRRSDSQTSKWMSDGQSNVKLAPQIAQRLRPHLANLDAQNQLSTPDPSGICGLESANHSYRGRQYPEDDCQEQPHTINAENTPLTTAGPSLPDLCIGVDPSVTIPEGFPRSLSLSDAPMDSDVFARFTRPSEATLTPITDTHLSFLEPFSGLGVPETVPPENGAGPTRHLDLSQAADGGRKVGPQTRFLQQFMEDLLELDIDLIRHTLEDPVVFDSTSMNTNPGGNGSTTPTSDCAIDTTFVLTQRFINLLRRGGNWTAQTNTAPNSQWKSPLVGSSSFSSRFQQMIIKATPQSTPGFSEIDSQQPETALDQASLLHALSTYLRLIETYHITFSQTADKFGTALAEGSAIPLPSLQIGAFAMDDPAGHIVLVIQSALQLLDRLGDLVNKLTAPFLAEEMGDIDVSRPPSPPNGHNAVKMIMVAVRERESQFMQVAARLQSCCREVQRLRG